VCMGLGVWVIAQTPKPRYLSLPEPI
jgi:hypothetical protein